MKPDRTSLINCIKLYAGEIPSKDGKIILDTENLALSN
jgi:hypothetical protein